MTGFYESVNAAPVVTPHYLYEHIDADFELPLDGESIKWDATKQKWVVYTPYVGGGESAFIPLAGTSPASPVTGTISFGNTGALGEYQMTHGPGSIANQILGFYTQDNNSGFQIQTRDAAGVGYEFYFSPDGHFGLPSGTSSSEIWRFYTGDYFGQLDTLFIAPQDAAGTILNKGVVIWTDTGQSFAFQQDGGLALPRDPTGQFEAATKGYVDALLGPGAGESNTYSEVGGGVGFVLTKSGVDLPFRTLTNPDNNITMAVNGNNVELSLNSSSVNFGSADIAFANALFAGFTASSLCHFNVSPTTDGDTSLGGATTLATKKYVDDNVGGGGAYVELTGAQTVNGTKTWEDSQTFNGGFGAGNVIINGGTVSTTWHVNGRPSSDFVTAGGAADTLSRKDYVDFSIGVVDLYDVQAGDGLSGGGAISTNPTLSVDSTVVRTTGAQTIGGAKTFSTAPKSSVAAGNDDELVRYQEALFSFALNGTNMIAGDGLTGGGTLQDDRTFNVDSTVVRTTGNQSISGAKSFTSAILADYGTEALPGYAFDGDPDTGMFRHGVNDIGWSCGGDEKMYLDANSLVLDEAVTGSTAGASIVARNTMIVDNLTSGGGSTAAWGIASDLIIQSSDLRLKENVQPNPHGLAAVLQMDTIEFDWIKGEVHDIGFSAQNMVEIIPEACPENGDGYYGFRELPVMAALVKAVQELNAKVEELESKHGV